MCVCVCIRIYFCMHIFNCAFPCISLVYATYADVEFYFSPSLSFIIYQFIFFLFSLVSLVPSLPFLYYSDTSSPVPLYRGLVPRDFFLSLNSSVLNFSLFSLRFLFRPSVRTHYYVPLSPGPTRRNLPWSSTGR